MYLIDTNFLGTLETLYPDDVFPSLWRTLSPIVFSSSVFFHYEVNAELKVWNSPRYSWYANGVNPHQILTPDTKELNSYQEVTEWAQLKRVPRYRQSAVDEFLDCADSWLVASAARHNAAIVTNEKSAPQSQKKVKIPDAANAFGVRCIDPLSFLRSAKIVI